VTEDEMKSFFLNVRIVKRSSACVRVSHWVFLRPPPPPHTHTHRRSMAEINPLIDEFLKLLEKKPCRSDLKKHG
jgi:hypothetical protein